MCRFVSYLGPKLRLAELVTEPSHSLVHQSHHAEERVEPLNGDGFGVAWFVPHLSPAPAVFRSIHPAWSNRCLHDLCRVTESPCILAHVRAASPGFPVVETNCHPFAGGGLASMHNGCVEGFSRFKRKLLSELSDEAYTAIEGTTDSEHVFALFRDHYARLEPGTASMATALTATIKQIVGYAQVAGVTEPITLNVVVTDGTQTVVSRYASADKPPSLYVHAIAPGENSGMWKRSRDKPTEPAVWVSSERLSETGEWQKVPANHMVLVDSNRTAAFRPIG